MYFFLQPQYSCNFSVHHTTHIDFLVRGLFLTFSYSIASVFSGEGVGASCFPFPAGRLLGPTYSIMCLYLIISSNMIMMLVF